MNRTKARESLARIGGSQKCLAFVAVNTFMLVSFRANAAQRYPPEEGWESGVAPSRENDIASRPALSISHERP